MKKIGKYGLYVPPTLAVLTAAPRAFAQSVLTATLSGYVEDSDTHTRIPGATVSVHCNPPLSTQTNLQGEYTIPNIPPGTRDVKFSATGYNTVLVSISFVASQVVIHNQCLT